MSDTKLVPTLVEGEPRIRDVDLAERLGFERPHDIRKLIDRHRENLSKISVLATVAQTSGEAGGRPTRAYYLNRKQAIFITAKSETPEATDITIEIIERFDAYERGLMAPPAPALTDDEIVVRALTIQQQRIEALQATVAIMAPKAEALDRIAGTDGTHCITDAAKALQVRPKDLFDYLSRRGWMYRRPGADHWCAYQAKIVAGDLVHKVTTVLRPDGSERTVEQVRITAQGLTKLAKQLRAAVQAAA